MAIVAPAKRLASPDLQQAISVVESWGLRVAVGRHTLTEDHAYLAATDDKRLADLQAAIDNPEVSAIFCVRGGYGVTRILDRLNLDPITVHPKWIVGFSDITALLVSLYGHGIKSIHGSMPVHFSKSDWQPSVNQLRNVLFEGPASISAQVQPQNRFGTGIGNLAGGNLSILADSLGTASAIRSQGTLLVLEEIDEDLYRLDRMLTHLKRAGVFDDLAGLAIGHLTDLRDTSDYREPFERMLMDKIQNTRYPVGFGFPIGHENPNLAWIVGQETVLKVSEQGATLTPVITQVA